MGLNFSASWVFLVQIGVITVPLIGSLWEFNKEEFLSKVFLEWFVTSLKMIFSRKYPPSVVFEKLPLWDNGSRESNSTSFCHLLVPMLSRGGFNDTFQGSRRQDYFDMTWETRRLSAAPTGDIKRFWIFLHELGKIPIYMYDFPEWVGDGQRDSRYSLELLSS